MSSKRRLRRRSCERKKRYEDKDAALDGMYNLIKRGKNHGRMNVYPCKFCGGFHVGGMPRHVRQAIQEKA